MFGSHYGCGERMVVTQETESITRRIRVMTSDYIKLDTLNSPQKG